MRVDFETSCLCPHARPPEVPTWSLRPPVAGFSRTFRKPRPANPLSCRLSAACEAARSPGGQDDGGAVGHDVLRRPQHGADERGGDPGLSGG